MSVNNTFDLKRLGGYLLWQSAYQRKALLLGLMAYVAVVFLFSFVIIAELDFTPSAERINNAFLPFFVFSYVLVAGISAGTAFSSLRSKNSRVSFFMLPVSLFEKLIGEYSIRILFTVLVYPFLFYAVCNLSTFCFSFLSENFQYHSLSLLGSTDFSRAIEGDGRMFFPIILQVAGMVGLILMMGAIYFNRYALIKTLATIFGIFMFFGLIAFMLEMKILFQVYWMPEAPLLAPTTAKSALILGHVVFAVGQLVMWSACYFKLKEREV